MASPQNHVLRSCQNKRLFLVRPNKACIAWPNSWKKVFTSSRVNNAGVSAVARGKLAMTTEISGSAPHLYLYRRNQRDMCCMAIFIGPWIEIKNKNTDVLIMAIINFKRIEFIAPQIFCSDTRNFKPKNCS